MQVIGYRSGIKLGNRLDLSIVGGRAPPPVTGVAHLKQGTGYDKPLSNVEMR